MHKNIKIYLAAVLLLCLSVSVVGCRTSPAPETTNQAGPSQAATTTPDTPGEETGAASEGTQETHGIITQDPNAPSLGVDTQVSDDRSDVGGSGNQQPETTPPTTKPGTTDPIPDDTLSMNYQQFMKLSGSEQQELFDKHFADDPLAFAAWFQKIKQEYDDETPEIIATGPIDIGDYITP